MGSHRRFSKAKAKAKSRPATERKVSVVEEPEEKESQIGEPSRSGQTCRHEELEEGEWKPKRALKPFFADDVKAQGVEGAQARLW